MSEHAKGTHEVTKLLVVGMGDKPHPNISRIVARLDEITRLGLRTKEQLDSTTGDDFVAALIDYRGGSQNIFALIALKVDAKRVAFMVRGTQTSGELFEEGGKLKVKIN